MKNDDSTDSRELSGISRNLIKILWAFQLKKFPIQRTGKGKRRELRCDERTASKMFIVVHSIWCSMSKIRSSLESSPEINFRYHQSTDFDSIELIAIRKLKSQQPESSHYMSRMARGVAKLANVCSRRRVIPLSHCRHLFPPQVHREFWFTDAWTFSSEDKSASTCSTKPRSEDVNYVVWV